MTKELNVTNKLGNLRWDIGTGYELFVSLIVLHQPELYGLRASWAAGIRSRIPVVERKFLEDVLPFLSIPLNWLYKLPGTKDVPSILWAVRQIPPADRIKTIFSIDEWDEPEIKILLTIPEKHGWDENDFKALSSVLCKEEKPGRDADSVKKYLDLWIQPEQFGEMYLSALQAFYQVFFEDEEKRLAPILKTALEQAQERSKTLELEDLLAELSQGVRFEVVEEADAILIPAYWTTPLLMHGEINNHGKSTFIFLFGARPDNMSIIPGEIVPESLLRTLKALADPTRLKIIHYLSKEELIPSELARRLHLRAPTVTHHLAELRLAGLVNLKLKGQEKRYTTRREALPAMFAHLENFLDNGANTPEDPGDRTIE